MELSGTKINVGIKKLIYICEMASQESEGLVDKFLENILKV